MKQIIIMLGLLAGKSIFSQAQSNITTYNGQKWEQLEGSGKLVTINPVIGVFNIIEINNLNVKIKVESGAKEYAMNILIDDNLKDFFKLEQVGNTLKLSFDMSSGKYPRWLSGNNTVITIKSPDVGKIINKGNSDIDINLQDQISFNLFSDGNPDFTITGKIKELNLQTRGNADIKAGQLSAEKIILSSNGNADIEVNTKELIENEMKGNNDIVNLFYNPQKEKISDDFDQEKDAINLVSFRLKNNSAFPSKITLVSYRPDRAGNGTTSFTLVSLGTKKLKFPAGTKIYLASKEQVNTVMSGAKISDQLPFLIVKKSDANKTFKIN